MVTNPVQAFVCQLLHDNLDVYGGPSTRGRDLERATLLSLGYTAFPFLETNGSRRNLDRNYSWTKLLALGLHPAIVRFKHGMLPSWPFSGDTHGQDHPLHTASMFLRHGEISLARYALDEHNLVVQEARAARSGTKQRTTTYTTSHLSSSVFGNTYIPSYLPSRTYELTWINPVPPSQNFKAEYDPSFARVGHFEWYPEEGKNAIFLEADTPDRVALLWRCRVALDKENIEKLIRQRAYKTALSALSHTGRTRYEDVVRLVQLMDPRDARHFLERQRGVSRVLGICRKDATEQEMITGLRTLCKASGATWDTMITRFGRPPTAKEIAAVTSAEIVKVLRNMPWDHLAPTLESESELSIIRGSLLTYVDRAPIDQLQVCLVEGEGRVVASRYYEENPSRARTWDFDDEKGWIPHFDAIYGDYRSAEIYREHLLEVCAGDAYLMVLATLSTMPSATPHMETLGATHPLWPQAAQVAREYRAVMDAREEARKAS